MSVKRSRWMLDMVFFFFGQSCNVTKCRQFQPFAAFLLAVTVGVGPDAELRSFLALLFSLGSAFEVTFSPTIFLPVNRFVTHRTRLLLPPFQILPLPSRPCPSGRKQVRSSTSAQVAGLSPAATCGRLTLSVLFSSLPKM